VTEYERQRLENIKRNKELLASLGLDRPSGDGGVLLPRHAAPRRTVNKQAPRAPRAPRPEPTRRSARTQGLAAVYYGEDDVVEIGRRHQREIYTVEHLLGLRTCKSSYDDHPNRLPANDGQLGPNGRKLIGRYAKDTGTEHAKAHGVTCHWCRQKDSSVKTECSECHSHQGRICGPCLQGRCTMLLFSLSPIEINVSHGGVCVFVQVW